MQSKSLLIAIAAFAVTATGAHAYGSSKVLHRAGLSDDQIEAIEEAQTLRAQGDLLAARDQLVAAGINETVIEKIRKTKRAHTHSLDTELKKVVEEGDYERFQALVAGTPLGEVVTSEEDFNQFKAAHRHQKVAGQELYGLLTK